MYWRSSNERRGWAGRHGAAPSSACFLKLALVRLDLNERVVGVYRLGRLIEHRERIGIVVFSGQFSLYGSPEPAQSAEGVVHGRSFVTAVQHTIRTLRIAGLRAVILPLGGVEHLLERIHVPIL